MEILLFSNYKKSIVFNPKCPSKWNRLNDIQLYPLSSKKMINMILLNLIHSLSIVLIHFINSIESLYLSYSFHSNCVSEELWKLLSNHMTYHTICMSKIKQIERRQSFFFRSLYGVTCWNIWNCYCSFSRELLYQLESLCGLQYEFLCSYQLWYHKITAN